ncbi:MAG: DNA primase [Gammaproteobacteria bacterium]|nr:DNA primase [Gammaproteobacteria bacterium]
MAGRIPDSFLETLTDRVNLAEVVSARMPLKKSGREYTGRCPFHDDSSPSFSVNPDKGLYHCFGCGASGGAVRFVMEFDRLDFVSAVELLAGLVGLDVPKDAEDPEAQKRAILRDVIADADTLFRGALKSHPEREPAIAYLKKRGLTGQIAHQFGLGFAPPGWRFLYDQLAATPSGQKACLDAGLTTQGSAQREYDRFRNRIMFPIRDIRGHTIAFGGRVLDDSKPKYLNSPETLLFHKSDTLYGLYEARQAHRVLERVLVVEGYMDVVALAQYGIPFAVATLGTALTSAHLDRLSRQTSQVILCFDGDTAGRRAAERALDLVLPFLTDQFMVRYLFLPDGEDPDTLVRKEGKDAFLARLNTAISAGDALLDLLEAQLDMRRMDSRARLSALALPKIARLPKGIYQSLLMDALAERTGVRRSDLDERLDSLRDSLPPIHASVGTRPHTIAPDDVPPTQSAADDQVDWRPDTDGRPSADFEVALDVDAIEPFEPPLAPSPRPTLLPITGRPLPLASKMLWMLLQRPDLAQEYCAIPSLSELPNVHVLDAVWQWLRQTPTASPAKLMGYFSGTETGRLLSALLKTEPLVAAQDLPREYQDALSNLKKQFVTERLKQLARDANSHPMSAQDLHRALTAHRENK